MKRANDRFKGDVVGADYVYVDFRFLSGFAGGLEFTIDGDISVLVETGVAFHARFGIGSASNYTEVMSKEAQTPFKGFG